MPFKRISKRKCEKNYYFKVSYNANDENVLVNPWPDNCKELSETNDML